MAVAHWLRALRRTRTPSPSRPPRPARRPMVERREARDNPSGGAVGTPAETIEDRSGAYVAMSRIVPDPGGDYFYVAGHFTNTLTLGGITLTAPATSGFVARVAADDGSVLWARRLGDGSTA